MDHHSEWSGLHPLLKKVVITALQAEVASHRAEQAKVLAQSMAMISALSGLEGSVGEGAATGASVAMNGQVQGEAAVLAAFELAIRALGDSE